MTVNHHLRRHSRAVLLACSCAVPLPAVAASLVTRTLQFMPESRLHVAQYRQCERRAGPYATLDTAWRRWREARARGFAVSRGVVPCYDDRGTRGYGFIVFYRC